MRFALAAALSLVSTAAFAAPRHVTPSTATLEHRLNLRLDHKLHATLQRLIDAQAYRSAKLEAERPGDRKSLLTQR